VTFTDIITLLLHLNSLLFRTVRRRW